MGKLSRHLGIVLLGLLVMAGLVFLPAKTVKADGELENGWCRFDPNDGTLYLKRGNTEMQRERYNFDQIYTNIKLPDGITPEKVYHVKTEGESGTVNFPADCSMLFYKFDNCSDFDFSNSNTSSVTNMASMFEFCDDAITIDISSFDTSNVTDMNSLFEQCGALKSVSFGPNFKTDSVTNMSSMFNNCYNLESLDLCTFTITANTKVDYMFYYCVSLESIYTNTDWPKPESYESIFYNNSKLKGGMGTVYDDAHRSDNAYLRIDKGESAPGYFTDKNLVPYMSVETKDNDYSVFFYIPLDRVYDAEADYSELSDYYVEFNNNSKSFQHTFHYDGTYRPEEYLALSEDGKYLYFKIVLRPNDIADNLNIIVYHRSDNYYTPDLVILDKSTTLEQYLKTVYNNSDYAALKPVVGNMIRYCSAAQYYYDNVSLDQVACKGLTGYELTDLNAVNLPDASDYSSGTDIKKDFPYTEITYWGSTTTFDKKISLILAFHFGGENDTYEERLKGYINARIDESVKVTYKYDTTDKYYLAVFTVPIKELDKVLLTFGNTNMSIVKYLSKSAEMNASDTAYVYLAKAMYQYHLAAKTIN